MHTTVRHWRVSDRTADRVNHADQVGAISGRDEYGACGSDLAQHGRDRIDQGAAICSRMASLQRGWDEVGRR